MVATQVIPGAPNAATSIALAPDGDILVGGSAGPGQTGTPVPVSGFLIRLLSNGHLDSRFGQSGLVMDPRLFPVKQVAAAPGARILALGETLIRLDHNGARDTTFGTGGAASLPAGFTAQHFAIQSNRDIALIGTVTQPDGSTAAALARLTPNGQPDPSFGTGGLAVLLPPQDSAGKPITGVTPGGLVVEPDGSIVLTERGQQVSGLRAPVWVLERVSASGALDTSFAQNSPLLTGSLGTFDPQLTAEGNILVAVIGAGGTGLIHGPGLAVISHEGKLLSPQPDLVPEFLEALAFVALPDGGYLVLENGYYGKSLVVAELEAKAGAKESGALHGAQIPVPLPGGASDPDSLLLAQPDGKLIVAGIDPLPNGQQGLFVMRMLGISRPASVELPSQRIHTSAHSVTLRLICSPAQECDGTAKLYLPAHHHLVLGSGSFSIGAGKRGDVVIRLTPTGRLHLRGAALSRVIITLVLADGRTRSKAIIVPGQH